MKRSNYFALLFLSITGTMAYCDVYLWNNSVWDIKWDNISLNSLNEELNAGYDTTKALGAYQPPYKLIEGVPNSLCIRRSGKGSSFATSFQEFNIGRLFYQKKQQHSEFGKNKNIYIVVNSGWTGWTVDLVEK